MITGSLAYEGTTQPFSINNVRGNGFDVALTMTGTNSVTLEREINGTWFTWGAAFTATGARHVEFGAATGAFRFNVGTLDTDPIVVGVAGDHPAFTGELEVPEPE